MIRPTPEVVKSLAMVSRQYPEVLEFLGSWRMHELEQLPQAKESTAVLQGRCQVLNELHRLIKDAPDHAAKSNERQPSNDAYHLGA